MVFADMPVNSKYCYPHNRSVQSMKTGFRKTDKVEGTSTAKDFQAIIDKCPEPPSHLSVMVLDWQVQNPERGVGVCRCVINMCVFSEFHRTSTIMERGIKCVMMHHGQWLKYAADILVIDVPDAEDRWISTDKGAKASERDQLGPANSKLRLPMPVEEFVIAKNRVEVGKAFECQSKKISDGRCHERGLAVHPVRAAGVHRLGLRRRGRCVRKTSGADGWLVHWSKGRRLLR